MRLTGRWYWEAGSRRKEPPISYILHPVALILFPVLPPPAPYHVQVGCQGEYQPGVKEYHAPGRGFTGHAKAQEQAQEYIDQHPEKPEEQGTHYFHKELYQVRFKGVLLFFCV